MQKRDLVWDGCLNVRDLGGHLTVDGRETRFGAYVRADALDGLSTDGWRALVDYGVRTVVDLRLAEERYADFPGGLPLVMLHCPLVPAFEHPDWDDIERISTSVDGPESTTLAYLEFLERYGDRFAEAVTAIASADEGTVLFHCLGGKDRTGLIAALMLSLAGVERESIAADYAVSADNLRSMLAAWIDGAEDDDERGKRTRISASPAQAMRGVLEALDARHGGAEAYLRAAGVRPELLARILDRLVG